VLLAIEFRVDAAYIRRSVALGSQELLFEHRNQQFVRVLHSAHQQHICRIDFV